MIWPEIVLLVFGFCCGSIMFGSIISKVFYRKKIKKYGSKNPGATNMGRVLGKSAGLLTFIFDGTKGCLAIGIALILKQETSSFTDVNIYIAGLGAVLGHCFSPLEKFQGGKGVATSIGVLLFMSPYFLPILVTSWIGAVILTSYVSVASVLFAASSLIIGVSIPSILKQNYVYHDSSFLWTTLDYKISICIIVGICLLMIVRHHANISRLLNDTEKKVGWLKFVKRIKKKITK